MKIEGISGQSTMPSKREPKKPQEHVEIGNTSSEPFADAESSETKSNGDGSTVSVQA